MHPHLRATVDAFVREYRHDPRCLGLYLSGSGGEETDDAYSDVDLDLVVADDAYDAIASDLRPRCERICGAIHLWFPEGQRPGFCNYAFLFEHGGEQFLYDFAVMTRSSLLASPHRRPGRVLFDRDGLLADLKETRRPAPFAPEGLCYTVDHYWIYAYLCGKYTRRRDLYKLLYIQQVLFGVHCRLLHALHPDVEWGWWPRDLHHLSAESQTAMLRYFPSPDFDSVRAALTAEVAHFGASARAACARWEQPYPAGVEAYVLRHLRAMGAVDSTDVIGTAALPAP